MESNYDDHHHLTLENNKGALILVSGIPGAGKSFISDELAKLFPKNLTILKINFDKTESLLAAAAQNQLDALIQKAVLLFESNSAPIITQDELLTVDQISREQNYDRFRWKENRKFVYDLTFKIMQTLLNSGKKFIILLDDNFLLNSMRKPYYKLAARSNLAYCETYIKADLATCLKRNAQRNDASKVPEDILVKAQNSFESTNYRPHQIIFENNQQFEKESLQSLLARIFEVLNQVKVCYNDEEQEELKKIEIRKTQNKNLVHQLDLSLRSATAFILAPKKDLETRNAILYSEISDLLQTKGGIKFPNSKESAKLVSSLKSVFLEIISLLANKEPSQTSCFLETENERLFNNNFKNFKKYADKVNQDLKDIIRELQTKTTQEWINIMRNESHHNLDQEIFREKIVLSLSKFWIGLTLNYLNNFNLYWKD